MATKLVYLTTLLLGVLLLFTLPASVSAQPTCDSTKQVKKYGYVFIIPVYHGSTNCILKRGASNRAVTALQTTLNHCYGQQLAVDGIYGPQTTAAVKVAQKRSGTTPDGIYGPKTQAAIKWWGTSGSPPRSGCFQIGKV